ncbi:hypothetical protein F4805DRAFT_192862 [Annulohypoxylon moriforme]|nr:hypothetical protein F4805DRAFT_192862 [Annulohypoxylon moriforme]
MAKLDESNLIRIRNNQRRSRARHKKYVEGLEERVRQSELKRVEANFEIQQAARQVVEENKKIRELLNRLGFSNEKITCFLRTGDLDVNDATLPESLHDQGDIGQALSLFLQQTKRSISDYDTFTSTPSPTSELSNIRCNSICSDAAESPTNNQEQPRLYASGTNEHSQLHNLGAIDDLTLELEVQRLSQCLEYNIPSTYGSPQPPTGLSDSLSGSQLSESFQYITDMDFQDPMSYEQEAGKGQHMTNGSLMASYSSPPSLSLDSNNYISPERVYQGSQYQDYTHSAYPSSGQYSNYIANMTSDYLYSSGIADYLTNEHLTQ